MKIGKLSAINRIPVVNLKTNELYTFSRSFTEIMQLNGCSVTHEELPPGHCASPAHWHTEKSELYFVLSGVVSTYVKSERYTASAGDYIFFESGGGEAHYIKNETNSLVVFIMISSCSTNDEIHFAG